MDENGNGKNADNNEDPGNATAREIAAPVPLNAPELLQRSEQIRPRRTAWWTDVMKASAAVQALCAFAIVIFTAVTLNVLQHSDKAANDQATSAAIALQQNRQATQSSQRPYVYFDIYKALQVTPTRLAIAIDIHNYGVSPALNLRATATIVSSQAEADSFFLQPFLVSHSNSLGSIPVIPPGSTKRSIVYNSDVALQQHGKSIPTLIFVARTEYQDLYGNQYRSSFCTTRNFLGLFIACMNNNNMR